MRQSLVFFLSFFILSTVNSQTPNWIWARKGDATYNQNFGNHVATDPNGYSYVIGTFGGLTAQFGSITLTGGGATSSDIFIAKYDPNGNILWAQRIGGTCWDLSYGGGIDIDNAGNCYVTGNFEGTATFGAFTLTAAGTPCACGGPLCIKNVFVAKYDANGNCIWVKQGAANKNAWGFGVSVDGSGNVYAAGWWEGSGVTTISFGPFTLTPSNPSDRDIYLVKYDNNGNEIWAERAGGPQSDECNHVDNDAAGNVYITGFFRQTAVFDTISVTASALFGDMYVAKYNSAGSCLWVTQSQCPPGVSSISRSNSISADASGNTYITGSITDTVKFGTVTLTPVTSFNYFAAKFDPNGNILWGTVPPQTGPIQTGNDTHPDGGGGCYVVGNFMGDITFGSTTLSCLNPSSDEDNFIVKYDNSGNPVWALQGKWFQKSSQSGGVSTDAMGNVYVCGGFADSVMFDTIQLVSTLSNGAAFLAKIGYQPLAPLCFDPAMNLDSTGQLWSVSSADLDGNGAVDLVATRVFDDSVAIFYNTGGGCFDPPVNYYSGSTPEQVVTGDFDKDGDQDFAVGNYGSDNISVFLNGGGGAFAPPVNYAAGANPRSISVADVNSDTNPDLVVDNQGGSVSVHIGTGTGAFLPAVIYPAGNSPTWVAVGNLNADASPDLAVSNLWSDSVTILLNTGLGTFLPAVNYYAGPPGWSNGSESVALGDWDQDGDNDLAIAHYYNSKVILMFNNGAGAFSSPVNYTAGADCWNIIAADMNQDTIADLVVSNYSGNSVSVLLGYGNGTFMGALNYTVSSGPRVMTVNDFNGDGIPDIAAAGYDSRQVSVLLSCDSSALTADFTASDTVLCPGDCVSFTELCAGNPSSWTWNFAGADSTGSLLRNPANICYATPGSYAVTLIAANCKVEDTLTRTAYITVGSFPAADAGPDDTISLGESITLNGTGGVNYAWSPSGTLSCDSCQNPSATPDTTTTYYLTVTDAYGCSSMDSVIIAVEGTEGLYVPTGFSPNNDGYNDVFRVYATGVRTFLLRVYNRWGEMVFETDNVNAAWDGVHKGRVQNLEVFVWHVVADMNSGTRIDRKGDVTLIR